MNAELIAPASVAELEAALADAASRGGAVTFIGGGTALGYGYAVEPGAQVIDCRRLDRIVEYAPADMVVEVEAGCTLATLQAALAPNRQRLALDPPAPERATIGGLVATGAYGPRRMRFGGPRDLIVGISLVRADGVRVRGGGKVVKNVAGFDLPKLAVGSLGTLAAIATATFRLHPMPETQTLVRIDGVTPALLRPLVRELSERRLEPAAMLASRAGTGYDAHVLFEGFSAGVAEQVDRCAALARDLGLATPVVCDPDELRRLDENARLSGALRFRAAAPPAQLHALCETLALFERACPDAWWSLYPALGIAFVASVAADVDLTSAALDRARTSLEALGGNLVLCEATDALRARVDAFGTPPASLGLMRELKARFDPERRLNRGRALGRL